VKKLESITSLYNKLEYININTVNKSKENLFEELVNTLVNYSNIINNPNLFTSMLELAEHCQNDYIQIIKDELTEDTNLNKNEIMLVEVVKKLEEQIKDLNEQNNELKYKQKEFAEEELNKLKRKLKEEKFAREETENTIQYIKQLNKDLETKIINLEDENKQLKSFTKQSVI
jgi:predicted RNase H-like nuclease (RuvC/YqgF family)